ncbi:MAG: cyclopropane-fatty-acyl-phospholipid synthase family protein [Pseudomonadota bacterium]
MHNVKAAESGASIVVTPETRQAALQGTPLMMRLAATIADKLRYGTLTLQLPDGRRLVFRGQEECEHAATINIKNYRFAWGVLLKGDIGFYESFADGDWDTPDLTAVLYIFARNADHIQKSYEAAPVLKWIENIRSALDRNTRVGAKRNIMAHYDLGNEFYEKWLDRTMTYSSARFAGPSNDLADAQRNKYKTLAQSIDLRPDDSVLEIGSGWGGFAEFAAKDVGARVTGLTISKAQYDYARERIFREGLAEKVEIRLQDYRDVGGAYDKVASIEMFEAVGKQYWPAYFSKVRDCLKPGGAAGLQIITIADRFFDHYLSSPDFIQRYVFPGGMLPSPEALKNHVSKANLAWRDAQSFGLDYARTLEEWHARFLDAWEEIASMGFNDGFKKLWRYYLSYCEAGFRARTIDVMQVAVTR